MSNTGGKLYHIWIANPSQITANIVVPINGLERLEENKEVKYVVSPDSKLLFQVTR